MFSVITPSFRQLEWLPLAIASVADQQGLEIEHIVQDAGTEGVNRVFEEVVARVAAPNYKAHLYVERDAGMYDAINRGLAKSSGEICAYLNCDEQYLPGALRGVAQYFATHPTVDVLFADAILVDADGTPLSYRRMVLPALSHLRVADLNILTCATFFRRRLIEQGHLFPTQLQIAGDQYWVFSMLKARIPMAVLREPLSIFTFTGKNLSHGEQAKTERSAWLSAEERRRRWAIFPFVTWHRGRKLLAGAYRQRDVTVKIYTRDDPNHRRKITAPRLGFTWPRPAK